MTTDIQPNPTATDRKYAFIRLGTGDYLLPDNDGERVWRISSYVDGPSSGLDDWPRDRTLWRVAEWNMRGKVQDADPETILSSDSWDELSSWHETRREAVGSLR